MKSIASLVFLSVALASSTAAVSSRGVRDICFICDSYRKSLTSYEMWHVDYPLLFNNLRYNYHPSETFGGCLVHTAYSQGGGGIGGDPPY